MKKHILINMCIVSAFSIFFITMIVEGNTAPSTNQVSASAGAPFSNGSGTSQDPFQIWDANDLIQLSQSVEYWDDSFIQMADIDLSNPNQSPFTPIGNSTIAFSGSYNGNSYGIENLLVIQDYSGGGLFGFVAGESVNAKAVIEHLHLINPQVTVSGPNIDYAGSLCGIVIYCQINDCSVVNCNVSLVEEESGRHAYNAGGLVGYFNYGSISNVVCTGSVQGDHWYPTTGSVRSIGGIAGKCLNSELQNCKFDGSVNSPHHNVGGFIGEYYYSSFDACSSSGTVIGKSGIGGFVGRINSQQTSNSIKNCYSQCNVSGESVVGGFSGDAYPSVSFLIQNCYSSGTVVGASDIGGFSGKCSGDNYPDYVGCFWNAEVNPTLQGISNYIDPDLIGETTANMQLQATYLNAGWDFIDETANGQEDIWMIDPVPPYPTLAPLSLSGSGTMSDPYLIYTKDQLLNPLFLEGQSGTMYIKLMDDIDFQGGDCPALFSQWAFNGVFDGNHKQIKNIYMENQQGFIKSISGNQTVVKNLTLVNPTLLIDIQFDTVGLLVGYNFDAVVDNCHVINGYAQAPLDYDPENNIGVVVGGLASGNVGTIRNSSFSGTLMGSYVGGLVVDNFVGGTIEDSYASVEIHAGQGAGGLVAFNYGVIRRCSTNGIVSCEDAPYSAFTDTGGLVGENIGYYEDGGIITDCYSSCDVSTTGKAAGGVVGSSWGGRIANCYATSSVTGYGYLGSFVGTIQTPSNYPAMGIIENCYSTGNVSGNNRVGGFAGENGSSIIRNCYSTGSATGVEIVGGLTGCIYFYPYGGYGTAIIDKCYSTGNVTGGSITGGMIGRHWGGQQIVTDSFWDTQSSGWTYSAGGTGKTTAQMQKKGTFNNAGWDFGSLWYMGTYPLFQRELSPLQPQIDAATGGDTIVVQPDVYEGKLYFKGKNITLTSVDPANPDIVATTILQGKGFGSVVTFDGTENETCVLSGFTITGGSAVKGGGVQGNVTSAQISKCVIKNNFAKHNGGGLFNFDGRIDGCIITENSTDNNGGGAAACDAIITNCLIYNNSTTGNAAGLNNCDGPITNCTIAYNTTPGDTGGLKGCNGTITNCITWGNDHEQVYSSSAPTYSCIEGGSSGLGNIDVDPLFVKPASGDYHLLLDSACIDAGDPASDYSNEPLPNGDRVNIGAFGNTLEAARSRDGLVPLGFEIINKTRIERTIFEYELSVVVHNTNPHDMTDVRMQLVDMDAAVLSVDDDLIVMDNIAADEIKTSLDTFTLTIDRSQLIASGKLTWELTYYVQGQAESPSLLTMPLSAIDSVPGDITGEGDVNLKDLAVMSGQWQKTAGTPSADIALPLDGQVGFDDLLYLAENWLGELTE